jgi:hypothetical protein
MKRQTLRRFAVSSALLGLMLTASMAAAQVGAVKKLARKLAGPSASQALVRPSIETGDLS